MPLAISGVNDDEMGLLEKSIRGLAPQVVRRLSPLWPQMLHILAMGQHYFSTFDEVEDACLPGVHWSRLF